MIPKGSKDVEVYDRSKKITISFIDKLYEKNCLKMTLSIEEDILTEKITERLNSTNTSLWKLENAITSKNFTKLKEFGKSLDFSETDFMNMYQSLFIVGVLGGYELFRKYLLMTLDRKFFSITGREGLGQLIFKLEKKQIQHGFDEYLDKHLRNALGHDWYWFYNNVFYYTIDPTLKRTKSLSLGELMIKKRQIELFTRSFTENAFDRIIYHKNNSKTKV